MRIDTCHAADAETHTHALCAVRRLEHNAPKRQRGSELNFARACLVGFVLVVKSTISRTKERIMADLARRQAQPGAQEKASLGKSQSIPDAGRRKSFSEISAGAKEFPHTMDVTDPTQAGLWKVPNHLKVFRH